MSGPLTMTADQAEALGQFLRLITAATEKTGCTLQPYGNGAIELPGPGAESIGILGFGWDAESSAYRIDDRIGS